MTHRSYLVTLKPGYYDEVTYNVAATSADKAIERARIRQWKDRKWIKKAEMDVVRLVRGDEVVV